MIEASEYVKQLVQTIDNTIKGSYDPLTGRTMVCNTKWARVGKIVKDAENVEYLINELVTDSYIVATPLEGETTLNGTIYLQDLFFITGTKRATNNEWTMASNNLNNKLPLVWLLEVISENGFGRNSSIEKEMDIRLFFLDETDPSQYYTADHREQVVKPMQKLMLEFIEVIEQNRKFKSIENYQYKTFSRFGVENEKGMLQNVLDANLSGVALEVTLTRYKENCKC
jgi:hypothetical protein